MAEETPQPKNMAIRMDERLPPCPFCGSNVHSVVSIPFDAEKSNRVITCEKCGAQGPTRWPPTSREVLDLNGARAAWKQRASTTS